MKPIFFVSFLMFSLVFNNINASANENTVEKKSENAVEIKAASPALRHTDQTFQWIGKLNINGQADCTTWILKHGVAVTAKHCFLHKDLNEFFANQYVAYFSIEFLNKDGQPLNIALNEVKFDQGSNDIVFLIYDKADTEDTIEFNHIFFTDKVKSNTPINLAGYTDASLKQIISTNCSTNGFQDQFPPTKMDPGYVGTFEDTTCLSWYGVSGGPVFSVDPITKVTTIYGVVTHTFDILESGEPDPSLMVIDQYGESMATMFSPFNTSLNLQSLIDINS